MLDSKYALHNYRDQCSTRCLPQRKEVDMDVPQVEIEQRSISALLEAYRLRSLVWVNDNLLQDVELRERKFGA
jgi:hypothetical protein